MNIKTVKLIHWEGPNTTLIAPLIVSSITCLGGGGGWGKRAIKPYY